MIGAEQMRAARGLIGWSQSRLAEASGLAVSTIKRMEGTGSTLKSSVENVLKYIVATQFSTLIPDGIPMR